jgi:hypothetical protein
VQDSWIPEVSGTFVTIVTAGAYAMAFAFEAGKAGAFGIPLEMVDLQLMPALFSTLIAMVGVLSAIQLVEVLIPLTRSKVDDHPAMPALRFSLIIFIISAVFWNVGRPVPWWLIWLYLGLNAVALLLHFLLLALQLGIDPRLWKERQHQLTPAPGPELPFTDSFSENPRIALAFICASVAILLSITAGNGSGRRERDFFITNQQPETIILRIYGERAVAAEFLRTEKRITAVYRILRLDDPSLTLRLERVGPITFTVGDEKH